MSSLPGYTLEDYVMWLLDIKVKGESDANFSLALAEAIGTATRRRPTLSKKQFSEVLKLFEEYREDVEYKLGDYWEETHGSWRDYAGYNFDFIPDEAYDKARNLIKEGD